MTYHQPNGYTMKKRHNFNYHSLFTMLFCALLATNALKADIISPDGRRPRRPGPGAPAPVPVPPPTQKDDKPPVPPKPEHDKPPVPPKPEPPKPEPPKPEPPRPHEHPLPPQPGLPGEKPDVGKPHEPPKPEPPPKKRSFWQRIKSWF